MFNYKLILTYLFSQNSHLFLKHNYKNVKQVSICIKPKLAYYFTLHIRLSSFFYLTQLVDMFVYEIPTPHSSKTNTITSILVYNFHNLITQQRLYCFTSNLQFNNLNRKIYSINELFYNANWLEREISELHNLFFEGKKDLRNLMLQYGDTNAPFRKIFPASGLKDLIYDTINDTLIYQNLTLQI